MAKILWLASYPKSGNTWLRAFLANYLDDADRPFDINRLSRFSFADMAIEWYERVSGKPAAELTVEEVNALRPAVHRFFANARPGLVFVKTHSALTAINDVPTITPDVTFGAVYVVRNPLDVAVSYGHHAGVGPETAASYLCHRRFTQPMEGGQVLQVLYDWSTHVRGWLRAPGLYLKLLRYEDMVANPTHAFGEVIDFLKLPRDRRRLKKAVRFSAFRELAGQEQEAGFRERAPLAERFFRDGQAGGWREWLPAAQVRQIVDRHREVMIEEGYLSTEGEILV